MKLITYFNISLCFSYVVIQKHKLPQTYDFHKYMVRSMEDEFNGILGIRCEILLT